MTAAGGSSPGSGPKGMDARQPAPRRKQRRRGAFRRIRVGLMKLRPLPWRGRGTRGAGALLGVLLLAALAGAALAAHYETRAAERAQALDRAAGRVFGAWVVAAHRAAQAHADAFETALETQVGIVLTVARLSALDAAPPDLPGRPGRNAAMTLGVIADGTAGWVPGGSPVPGSSPVPMAFGVLEPAASSRPSAMREGALEAGLAAVAPGGGTLMEAHRAAIEAALGRSLGPDALWVTADRGLHYRERALYRRAQPGRPWLNRMETALEMAPPGAADPADPARRHVNGAGAVDAESVEIGTDVAVGGTADIGGRADAAGLTAETVEAGDLAAAALAVTAELVVGAAAADRLAAGRVTAAGSLEAGAVRSTGALDAAALSVAGAASVQGAAAARSVAGEKLDVAGALSGTRTAAGGVYGPDATISGLLTVGSCAGCEGQ